MVRNIRVTLRFITTLASHNLAVVSITENIDCSNTKRMLFTHILGNLSRCFFDSWVTHVSERLGQRAIEVRHSVVISSV